MSKDTTEPKKKLGVIGSEKRFADCNKPLPGPGDYNTQIFKSLNKC